MAVLAAAQDAAVDVAATNGDLSLIHVGPSVEVDARVALAGAVEVARDGVGLDLRRGARHTDSTAFHRDGGLTRIGKGRGVELIAVDGAVVFVHAHISGLAAAIHAAEDVAASDFHGAGAVHLARLAVPMLLIHASRNFLDVRQEARAAAVHVAEPGSAVCGFVGIVVRIIAARFPVDAVVDGNQVEGVEVCVILPVVGFIQGVSTRSAGDRIRGRIDEFVFGIKHIFSAAVARADLSVVDGHLGVAHDVTHGRAAIHRAFHPRLAVRGCSDGHLGLADGGHEVDEVLVAIKDGTDVLITVGRRVSREALAAAEHVAAAGSGRQVSVGTCAANQLVAHLHPVGADAPAVDLDLGLAGADNHGEIGNCSSALVPGVVAHVGHLAAAKHVAVDDGGDVFVFL